jgi:hypothetical protein
VARLRQQIQEEISLRVQQEQQNKTLEADKLDSSVEKGTIARLFMPYSVHLNK